MIKFYMGLNQTGYGRHVVGRSLLGNGSGSLLYRSKSSPTVDGSGEGSGISYTDPSYWDRQFDISCEGDGYSNPISEEIKW